MGIASKGSEPAAGDHIVVHRRVLSSPPTCSPPAPTTNTPAQRPCPFRGLYTHHGIYLGNGRIAHKVAGTHTLGVAISSVDASVRLPTGGVVLTDVCGFCPEAKSTDDFSLVEVVHYAQCFHPDDTVELALAAARGPRTSVSVSAAPLAAPYQLMSHNCEHFATYCKTGEHVSLQVLAVRGAIHRFGALAAGLLAGTATLARLEYAERTTTRVEHHPGGALGLKRRKVVTTETEVDVGRVLTGAAVIGLVSATTFGIVSRLQAHIREGKRYILAVRLCGPDGRPAGCDCSQVITVPRRVVRRGKAALRAFLVQEMEGAPLAEEMRFYDATTRQFVSIHTDVAVALPRCATVTVVLAPAGAKAPAMA